jgi:hypothetical protein
LARTPTIDLLGQLGRHAYTDRRYMTDDDPLLAATRFTVVCAHRHFGKTTCAIALLVTEALRCKLPSPRYASVAPFLKQARNVSWDYIRSFASERAGPLTDHRNRAGKAEISPVSSARYIIETHSARFSLQDLVGFLSEIHAAGVDLFLRQQGIDTTTPGGKAMFQMLGVFAEFERTIMQERVRAGLRRAKAEGKKCP